MGGMTPEERAVMLYNYVAEDEQLREQGDRGMDLRALFARQIRAAVAEAYEDAARLRAVLVALRTHPVVDGMTCRIRDQSKEAGTENPIPLADAALARVARLEAALRMASDELQHDYAHTHPVIVAIDAALEGR